MPADRGKESGEGSGGGRDIPKHTSKHPAQPQSPAHGGVPPDAAPAEDQVGGEGFPGCEGGEEDEGRGDGVEG